MPGSPILVATDADNTLWDTDIIYAEAQLALLEHIEKTVGRIRDNRNRLDFVRFIDQQLAASCDSGLTYPPRLLIGALRALAENNWVESSVADFECLSGTTISSEDRDALADYKRTVLSTIPELRPGVRDGMALLATNHLEVLILTESSSDRCEMILGAQGLRSFVGDVVTIRKDAASYVGIKIQRSVPGTGCVMIGDQLERDIGPAQSAGFKAIYFPGGFRPSWESHSEVVPDLVVSSYLEACEFVISYQQAM